MQSFFLLLAAALGTSAAVTSRAPLEINTPCAVSLLHPLAPVINASRAALAVQVRSCSVASLLAPLNTSTAQCEPLLITWSGGIRASTSSLVVRIPQVLI
ncbi:hypothetical protein B0H14DRAFT_2806538 [Mycena olivaceomarginata]|nr:hypothetical protein B0H14DRAFT_2806538 [Mycena olivaceomarginata]